MLKRKKTIHKRHFQLLELMVAMFILLVAVAPMMQIYTSMYRSQQSIVRDNQRDHLAHQIHTFFTEQLYKNAIELGDVKDTKPLELHDNDLIAELNKLSYECTGSFTLLRASPKKKPKKYFAKLEIELKDTLFKPYQEIENKKLGDNTIATYDYYIYIDSQTKEESEAQAISLDKDEDDADDDDDQQAGSP